MLETTEHRAMLIRGGRVIDPATGRDEVADVAITDGVVAKHPERDAMVIEAAGWIVCPGLWDVHVHLREPGQTHKETIETGTAAAAAGGFTFVACMPNTIPTVDSAETVEAVCSAARRANHCRVGPVGAITRSRAGRELTDFASLLAAGAVAFSDDGSGVEDEAVMRAAFQLARKAGAVLMQHCEYHSISAGGVMHLGEVSERLGMDGLDPRSEEEMIERDLALLRETGGRYHVAHVSTGRAVELIRQAKVERLPVTAEVSPHHLALTDEACLTTDPNTKMHPPLRRQADVDACRRGLLDGTIDCIATDHAPHTAEEKAAGFAKAPPGIVGLETAIGVAAGAMIETGLVDWPKLITWFTAGPAAILGAGRRPITPGTPAELALIDPICRWTVDPSRFVSKNRNTPFAGRKLTGQATGTIRGRQWNRPSQPVAGIED